MKGSWDDSSPTLPHLHIFDCRTPWAYKEAHCSYRFFFFLHLFFSTFFFSLGLSTPPDPVLTFPCHKPLGINQGLLPLFTRWPFPFSFFPFSFRFNGKFTFKTVIRWASKSNSIGWICTSSKEASLYSSIRSEEIRPNHSWTNVLWCYLHLLFTNGKERITFKYDTTCNESTKRKMGQNRDI